MGQITSLFVHKVVRQVSPGVEMADLLQAVDVDPNAPVDPSRMVASQAYYDFLAALVRRDPEGQTLPLRTGASMLTDDYGAFGLAWKSAASLRGSYNRAERYARVLTSVSGYEVEDSGDGAYVHLRRAGERTLGMRASNEASIASVYSISQQVSTRPITPLAVFFQHEAPGSASAHEEHFGCPVRFGSDLDALLLSHDALNVPNRLGDPAISQFFDQHLEAELAALVDDTGLEQRVRIAVSQSLSEGMPTLSDIATNLGMSARTLQRRLSDKGHSFQSLVDLARRELAEQLLRETSYSLAEVAFLTGFAEQSGFTRAFKRWGGQTPRSFRLSVQTP